jgi:UDP-glucuronate 4-epimerase
MSGVRAGGIVERPRTSSDDDPKPMKVLITGSSGFIGFHLTRRFLARGDSVIGVDILDNFYDVGLKEARQRELDGVPGYRFLRFNLACAADCRDFFTSEAPDVVVHLAARPGVRSSLIEPAACVENNVTAFANVLEGCRQVRVSHLVYASSSSVYGAGQPGSSRITDDADRPLNLYAATKRANELMAHSYRHLYGLSCTGIRLFSVYGPWGRPDMALFTFTRAILAAEPVVLYNRGAMGRDFTYIDDVIEAIIRIVDRFPATGDRAVDAGGHSRPASIYNIGSGRPVAVLKLLEILENCLGQMAIKKLAPAHPGEAIETWADIEDLERDTGFRPNTPIEVGIARFVEWYRWHYQL